MKVIKNLSEKIDEELEDAHKYIKCAHRVKETYPQLAEVYFKLSLEEMKHVQALHDEVVKIINDYKKTHEVPESMQAVYDYLHEKQMEKSSKIKAKQESFKQ